MLVRKSLSRSRKKHHSLAFDWSPYPLQLGRFDGSESGHLISHIHCPRVMPLFAAKRLGSNVLEQEQHIKNLFCGVMGSS
jgi:hypothetical protein